MTEASGPQVRQADLHAEYLRVTRSTAVDSGGSGLPPDLQSMAPAGNELSAGFRCLSQCRTWDRHGERCLGYNALTTSLPPPYQAVTTDKGRHEGPCGMQ